MQRGRVGGLSPIVVVVDGRGVALVVIVVFVVDGGHDDFDEMCDQPQKQL